MIRRKLISIVQFSYVIIICSLLAGKLGGDQSISINWALCGAVNSFVAFFIAKKLASRINEFEVDEPKWSLFFMRITTISFVIVMSLFTVDLYLHFGLAKPLIIAFVLIGATSAAAGKMSKWLPTPDDN